MCRLKKSNLLIEFLIATRRDKITDVGVAREWQSSVLEHFSLRHTQVTGFRTSPLLHSPLRCVRTHLKARLPQLPWVVIFAYQPQTRGTLKQDMHLFSRYLRAWIYSVVHRTIRKPCNFPPFSANDVSGEIFRRFEISCV